jgi:3',5'-cyclic AMP phosphodiesterase CpdA
MAKSRGPGRKAPDEFRLAHLSDLHVSSDLSALRHRLRSWVRQSQAKNLLNLQAVIRDLASQEVDHLIITGDLTNNSRDASLESVREALGEWNEPERLTIVPGNHDLSYRRRARGPAAVRRPRKLSQLYGHFPTMFPREHPPELRHAKKEPFPFVKTLAGGKAVLIGLDTTGRLTTRAGPLNSFGTISRAQFRELRSLLKNPWLHDRIKIVAMHHHPVIVPVATFFDSFKHLFQSKQLLDLLYESHVDLILHGHKHHPFCWQSHTFRDHDLTIICAGPPDAYADGKQSGLVYNIYSIRGHRISIHYRTLPPTQRLRPEFNHARQPGVSGDETETEEEGAPQR